ncbi:hypothetical protein Slin15195_G024240 [Septoria linicola]|uniref:F-box domain-containing protein n=1 Tax=Septoria linicola TaxID=215465 RepID=A0A9Q9AME5_9PEZI|nr:hypothetical protein Slin14017_G023330 [Septoria linicola]USW49105.1 hypothetical protein Slin15195_G024240 [Septoria linicola]
MDEVTEGSPPPRSNAADLDKPVNDLAAPAPSEDSFEDEDGAILEFLHRTFAEDEVNPDTTRSDSAFFGVLPREIRNQIYREVSFHDPHCFNFEAMSELFTRIRQRRRAGHSETLPINPLRVFAVSKQFYGEAVEEWMRERTIKLMDPEHLSEASFIAESCGVFRERVTRFEAVWPRPTLLTRSGLFDGMRTLKCCKLLHTLTLHVEDHIFDDLVNGFACDTEFSAEDFASIREAGDVIALKSIKKVVLIPRDTKLAHKDNDIALWTRNVSNLQDYMQTQIDARWQQKVPEESSCNAVKAGGSTADVKETASYLPQPEQTLEDVPVEAHENRSRDGDKSLGIEPTRVSLPFWQEHGTEQDDEGTHEEFNSNYHHAKHGVSDGVRGWGPTIQPDDDPGFLAPPPAPPLHGAGATMTRELSFHQDSVLEDSVLEDSGSEDEYAATRQEIDALTWITLSHQFLQIFAGHPMVLGGMSVLTLAMAMVFTIMLLRLLLQVPTMLLNTLFALPYWAILMLVVCVGRNPERFRW